MSKKLAALLCLLITVVGIPLSSRVYAATTPTCDSISVVTKISYGFNGAGYDLTDPKASIPEGVNDIYFVLTGSFTEGATYRLNFGYGQTNETQASKGKIDYLVTTDPNLLRKRVYEGTLQQKNAKGDYNDSNYCTGVNYRVGNTYDTNSCIITLNPDPTIDQRIVANISQSPSGKYYFLAQNFGFIDKNPSDGKVNVDNNGNGSFTFKTPDKPLNGVTVFLKSTDFNDPYVFCFKTFDIKAVSSPSTTPECVISPSSPTVLLDTFVTATNLEPGKRYWADVIHTDTGRVTQLPTKFIAKPDKTAVLPLNEPPKKLSEGKYSAKVYKDENGNLQCSKDFTVGSPGSGGTVGPAVDICKDPTKCAAAEGIPCGSDPKDPGIATAIGCIHTNPLSFIKDFLKFIIGISGGVAFLLMLLGAFQMVTSAGNPETLQAGRDRFQSAIIGLLFVIFAVLLLQIIGVGILGIEGFGR